MANYITEAFKKFDMLEDLEEFDINAGSLEDMKSFIDVNGEDDFTNDKDIFDLEAQAEEDLKQSYLGKAVLKCNVCQSLIFEDPNELTENEDGIINIDTECPYCLSYEGYKIIGKIEPYNTEEPKIEPEVEVEVEPIEESVDKTGTDRLMGSKEISGDKRGNGVIAITGDDEKLLGHKLDKSLHEELEDEEVIEESQDANAVEKDLLDESAGDNLWDKIAKAVGIEKDLTEEVEDGVEDEESLQESVESIKVETDSDVIDVTPHEDGQVDVSVKSDDSKLAELDGYDNEMVAPASEEDFEPTKIDADGEPLEDSDEDFEVDDFDEDSFNELGESYLKKCYENVNSFKTVGVSQKNESLMVEGVIGFSNGNKKSTTFTFNPVSLKGKRLKLEGFNKQLASGNKPFKVNCIYDKGRIIAESLNYNYTGKNSLNESMKVSGTVKKNKKK